MLLVDHDHAQVLERREQGRARAHRDGGRAAAQALPLLEALAGPQAAVQHGQLVAEARAQPRHDLVGERDLGNQHQGLPPEPSASSTARRYTSVFPLPVTPRSNHGANCPSV